MISYNNASMCKKLNITEHCEMQNTVNAWHKDMMKEDKMRKS